MIMGVREMFAHFCVYVVGGLAFCGVMGVPKADTISGRFSEAMYAFPVTMMMLMISYTCVCGQGGWCVWR